MSGFLHTDTDDLRPAGRQPQEVTEEAAAVVSRLRAALDWIENCWGDDEPGRTFAKTYVSGSSIMLTSAEKLAAESQATSRGVAGNVAFTEQDRQNTRSITSAARPIPPHSRTRRTAPRPAADTPFPGRAVSAV